jgi:hypothetical protein
MYHEDAGFLATSLCPDTTGVDGAIVWILAGEPTRNHLEVGPRILVVPGERLTVDSLADAVAVPLTRPPAVLGILPPNVQKSAVEFAARNRNLLLEYWRGKLPTGDAIDRLVHG